MGSTGISANCIVEEAVTVTGGIWLISPLLMGFNGTNMPNLNNYIDKLVWLDGMKNPFMTKNARESIRKKGIKVKWSNLIWKVLTISRCSFTSWVIVSGRLPTLG